MKFFKKVIAPLFVFILGVVSGLALTVAVVLYQVRKVMETGSGPVVQAGNRYLQNRLSLDEAQRAKFSPVVAEVKREVDRMRLDDMARVRLLIERVAAKIRPDLRPEQQAELDKLLSGPRERWGKALPASVAPAAPVVPPEKKP